jgi:hypothetical protein
MNMNTPQPNSNSPVSAAPPESKISVWAWAFRFLRWSTYLAALVTLILILHKTPPPIVQTTPQAAASAEAKVQQVQQSVEQGQPATLRLSESELNSYLASHLNTAQNVSAATAEQPAAVATPPVAAPAADPVKALTEPVGSGAPTAADIDQARSTVKDVKVQMEGDLVKAYVVFDVHGKDMTLVLQGHIGATNGYLDFQPVSGQIGSLPIPQSALVEAVKRMMDSPDNREKLKLPSDISDLHVVNGELVTTYH